MSHKHLTIDERIFIDNASKNGKSLSSIANSLGRNKSTISREINRFPRTYNPIRANALAIKNRKIIRKQIKITANSLVYLIEKATLNWSPDEIVNRYQLDNNKRFEVSVSTIYPYFQKGLFQLNKELLRHKGKYRRKNKTSETKKKVKLVMDIIRKKTDFGHWEADLIVGKHHKSHRLTITETLTNLTLSFYLEDKTTEEVSNVLIRVFSNPIIKNTARTITVDNGTEFANWKLVEEEINIPIYFARPGTPWEKPSIEHANKLLREYFPKKSNLKDFSPEYDLEVFNRLNSRPRKKLGYKTPLEELSLKLIQKLNQKLLHFRELKVVKNIIID